MLTPPCSFKRRLTKHDLIGLLKRVEYDLGRARILGRSTHVPIDIDLLAYDGVVQMTDMWDLAYRAVPTAELVPDLTSPVTGESLSMAAARLSLETRIVYRWNILDAASRPPDCDGGGRRRGQHSP